MYSATSKSYSEAFAPYILHQNNWHALQVYIFSARVKAGCSLKFFQNVLLTVLPSPPVTPEAYDKTKDSVSLKWKLPRHDGKGRIFGYLVEYQKPGAVEWIPANETPEQCPDLHYVVTGLTDGQEYTFRIFTVNAAGKSDPAYVKETIKVHDRLGRDSIYKSYLIFCDHV